MAHASMRAIWRARKRRSSRRLRAPSTLRHRARALHLLGQIYARRSSFTEAMTVAFQALALAADDAELRAEMELDLAFYDVSVGDLTGAEEHARSAVAAAEMAGSPSALGGCSRGCDHGGVRSVDAASTRIAC